MQCRYCGSELVPGAIFCPHCGKPVESSEFASYEYTTNDQPAPAPTAPPAPVAPITPVAQQAAPAQQASVQPVQPSAPEQPAQAPSTGQQDGSSLQQPPLQEQQVDKQAGVQAEAHTQWPSFQPPQVSPPSQWPPFQGQQPVPGQPNQPLYQPQQPYVNPQYYQGAAPLYQSVAQPTPGTLPPAPQPPGVPPRQRGLSPAMVALLVILALLVGGGGVFAYFAISHRSQPPTSSSSIPTITATDPQQLYTQATAGTPTLNDPLNASNPNGWEAVDSGNTCEFGTHSLEMSAPATKAGQTTIGICLARATNFTNFAYEVNTTIVQGDTTGVVFRADQLSRSIYFFGVSFIGTYVLFTTTTSTAGQTSLKILAEGTSQAIHTGANQSNLLAVIARGSTIDLYANKQYLNGVTDNTAVSGLIGVFGQNIQGGAVDVLFSSIKVWQL